MSRLALVLPILSGQEQAWREFGDQLAGPRYREFIESRRRLRVREVTFRQKTSEGEFVIMTLEGQFVAWSLLNLTVGQDDFTTWFVEQVKQISGVDLRNPEGDLPEEVIDSGALTDENKAVVRRFIKQVLNAHDADAAPEIYAANYRNHFPGAPEPLELEATKAVLRELFAAFPDLHAAAGNLFAEDHMVATRIKVTGTHKGEFRGIPATGNTVSVVGLPQWRVVDRQIVEDWPGLDMSTLLEQLGASHESPATRT